MSFRAKTLRPIVFFTKDGEVGAVWADYPDREPLVRSHPPPYESFTPVPVEAAYRLASDILGFEVEEQAKKRPDPITIVPKEKRG